MKGKPDSKSGSSSSGDAFPHDLDIIDDADVITLPDGTTELITDRPHTTVKPSSSHETRETSNKKPDDEPRSTVAPTTTSPAKDEPSLIERLFGIKTSSTNETESGSANISSSSEPEQVIKLMKRQAPPMPSPLGQQPQILLLHPQQPQPQPQIFQQPQQGLPINQIRVCRRCSMPSLIVCD